MKNGKSKSYIPCNELKPIASETKMQRRSSPAMSGRRRHIDASVTGVRKMAMLPRCDPGILPGQAEYGLYLSLPVAISRSGYCPGRFRDLIYRHVTVPHCCCTSTRSLTTAARLLIRRLAPIQRVALLLLKNRYLAAEKMR